MKTNFTIRDFFMYLLTGCIFILLMAIIFHGEIIEFLMKYKDSFKNFEWIGALILIPAIYLVGHVFGGFSFLLLKLHKNRCEKCERDANRFECKKDNKYNKCKKNYLLLYAKTTYAIEKNRHRFESVDDFWTKCKILQIEDKYAPAQYFYYINELFQSLIIIFGFSSIVAFISCISHPSHWIIGIIYIVLALCSCIIARDHALSFVQEVIRTLDAREEIRKEEIEMIKIKKEHTQAD